MDVGDEDSVYVSRKERREQKGGIGGGVEVSVQQAGVRDSDGDGGQFPLLPMTVHLVARDRLLRLTTRLDGGGGRWAGDSRTFEALKEDCWVRMGCSEFKGRSRGPILREHGMQCRRYTM